MSRPRTFRMMEKVMQLDEKVQHMYLIVEGHALLFNN